MGIRKVRDRTLVETFSSLVHLVEIEKCVKLFFFYSKQKKNNF